MHFQNSCTRNCDNHILLIMTGNAHKESCNIWLILKGEGIETQSKLMVAFTITRINYLVVSLFCDIVLPFSHVYWPAIYICGIKLFWLRNLSCFRSPVALQLRAPPKVSARAPAHRSYHFRGVKLKSCIKKIHHNLYISKQANVRIKHADTEGASHKKFDTDARVQ